MNKHAIDEIGNKYGSLVVIERAENHITPDGTTRAQWLCKCSCGNENIITGTNLRKGYTKSCGRGSCHFRSLPFGEASFNALFRSYKDGAKERGYRWELSKNVFEEITQQNCFYCGMPPSASYQSGRFNGDYIYNGVDRMDNDKGYIVSNVVPCCRMCNVAKNDRSLEDFRRWTERLCENWLGYDYE